MVYTADRHIWVNAAGEQVDPNETPGESAFLVVAPGQSMSDEQAAGLGLTGKGEGDRKAALMAHIRGSGGVFTGPDEVVSKPGGHKPGDVEHVMLFSGVSRATAEMLAAADQVSAEGFDSQVQTETALREASRQSAPRQLGEKGSVETSGTGVEPGMPATSREAAAESGEDGGGSRRGGRKSDDDK